MGLNKRSFLLIIFLAIASVVMAGNDAYVIFLTDKQGSEFSIDKPDEFLSPRAIDRRNNQRIVITEQDLPVSKTYIHNLKDQGFEIVNASKWFNAVLVKEGNGNVQNLAGLDFVSEYYLVAHDQSGGRTESLNGTNEIEGLEVTATFETTAQNDMLGVIDMHKKGYKGKDILIGVFDSGFEYVDHSPFFNHLFNNDQIIATRDFVNYDKSVFQYDTHGSKVLSCIGGFQDQLFEGTAYEAGFVLCVTEDVNTEYRIEEYNWLFAAEYADSLGVDIINSSVGYSYFDDPGMNYTYEDMNGHTTVITRAAVMAASKGMIVVSSNGNEGNKSWKYLNAPSDADSILAIGAVSYDLARSKFSSFGPTSDRRIKPDLCALGTDTKVVRNDYVTTSSGTSFSTPLVSGLVAGFWQANRDLTAQEVITYLKTTASLSHAPDTILGYGVPNFVLANRAVERAVKGIENEFIIYPNPLNGKRVLSIESADFEGQDRAEIVLYDLKGSKLKEMLVGIDDPYLPIKIDLTALIPGHYILTCKSGRKVRKSKLVVK